MRLSLLACMLIALTAGLSQAETVAKPVHTAPKSTPKQPPRGLSDAYVEQTIRGKLAKSKINTDHFTVKVHDGVATWEGKTEVIQHKGVATRMARTSGATQVINNIQVSDAARQRAAGYLSGKAPRAQVQSHR